MTEIDGETDQLGEQYREIRPLYENFAERLKGLLTDLLKAEDLDVLPIESRAKQVESFVDKVGRNPGKYPEPFAGIHDLAGIRIIGYYLSDIPRIDELVEREFEVDPGNSWKGSDRGDPDRFGYASDHYVVSVSPGRRDLPEWRAFAELKAEIQVRTVLQHAWAAIDHKLVYKRAQDIPAQLRRQLSRVSALLEVADEQFESARSSSAQLDANYDSRASTGDLDLPVDVSAIRAYVQSRELAASLARIGAEAGFIIDEIPERGIAELTEASRLAGFANVGDLDGFLRTAESWAPRVLPVLREGSSADIPWRMPTAFLLATLILIGHDFNLEEVRKMTSSDDFYIIALATARAALASQ